MATGIMTRLITTVLAPTLRVAPKLPKVASKISPASMVKTLKIAPGAGAKVAAKYKTLGQKALRIFSLPAQGLKKSLGGIKSIGGFLAAGLGNGALGILLLATLFPAAIRGISYVLNFNWNISDTALEEQVKSAYKNLLNTLGEAVGSSLAQLVCGLAPGVLTLKIDPLVGRKLLGSKNPQTGKLELGDLSEEIREEIIGNLATLAYGVFNLAGIYVFNKTFLNVRRHLRDNPNHLVSQLLIQVMGKKEFESWGKKEKDPFSFALLIDKQLDKIKDPVARELAKDTLYSFAEGCYEASVMFGASALANLTLKQDVDQKRQTYGIQISGSKSNAPRKKISGAKATPKSISDTFGKI